MKKKPLLFEAACILSIIGGSLGLISMLAILIFYDQSIQLIEQLTNITAADQLSPGYFAVQMAAFSISLSGAIQLFRLKRIGLYFYLCGQLLLLLLPVLWMNQNAFSTTNAIFVLIFAAIYLFYAKITR
jgi:hypothetical protein